MGTIWVNVEVLIGEKFVTMFRNVKLEVEEKSNSKMNKAFEEQHPILFNRIPTSTDARGFTFGCAFECTIIRKKKNW